MIVITALFALYYFYIQAGFEVTTDKVSLSLDGNALELIQCVRAFIQGLRAEG